MSSYQLIETDLAQIKDQVEFVMKAIRVAQPSPLVGMPSRVLSLFDLYMESKRAGLTLAPGPLPEVTEDGSR